MARPEALEQRLTSIALALQATGDGLGLLALGSVGVETARLDDWSDLDFFLLVKPGTKGGYCSRPEWFETVSPVAWTFRNTADGYKLLFHDGIFAEMAWFEPQELAAIPYAPGRWIWRDPELDETLKNPRNQGSPAWKPDSAEWALGELLSCLYVGLGRWNRGEKLSAWRFVQGHCLDRFLEIVDLTQPSAAPFADYYNRDRRWESRHPQLAAVLPGLLAGYDQTPRAAAFLLDWCESHFEVNQALAEEIRRLAR